MGEGAKSLLNHGSFCIALTPLAVYNNVEGSSAKKNRIPLKESLVPAGELHLLIREDQTLPTMFT